MSFSVKPGWTIVDTDYSQLIPYPKKSEKPVEIDDDLSWLIEDEDASI
jgi:hypothetical protein